MSSESVSRAFCLESLRYAYQILGYDTVIKEIEFIHHLHSKYSTVCQPSSNSQNTELIVSDSLQNTVLHPTDPLPNSTENPKIELQKIAENTDQQKEIVLKAKRGRKPLSSKNTEHTEITEIKPVIIQECLSCSYPLSNGSLCSIKRYTKEDPLSVYCYHHYPSHK